MDQNLVSWWYTRNGDVNTCNDRAYMTMRQCKELRKQLTQIFEQQAEHNFYVMTKIEYLMLPWYKKLWKRIAK